MVTVIYSYDTPPVNIEESLIDTHFMSNAFPNPANSYTSFRYKIEENGIAQLIIRNILGQEMERHLLDKEGIVSINTKKYTSGAYIYTFLFNNNVIKARKLLISH